MLVFRGKAGNVVPHALNKKHVARHNFHVGNPVFLIFAVATQTYDVKTIFLTEATIFNLAANNFRVLHEQNLSDAKVVEVEPRLATVVLGVDRLQTEIFGKGPRSRLIAVNEQKVANLKHGVGGSHLLHNVFQDAVLASCFAAHLDDAHAIHIIYV